MIWGSDTTWDTGIHTPGEETHKLIPFISLSTLDGFFGEGYIWERGEEYIWERDTHRGEIHMGKGYIRERDTHVEGSHMGEKY